MAPPTDHPKLGRETYLAPSAVVAGSVTIGRQCTVMHHVVIRGDVSKITIGNRVNVQDGTVIHTDIGEDLTIGDDVVIGHRAVIHCSSIGSRTLIGIGAILLDGCVVGPECVIAAGAVLAPRTVVPPRTLVMGLPGRAVRPVTNEELAYVDLAIQNYIELGRRYLGNEFPAVNPLGSTILDQTDQTEA